MSKTLTYRVLRPHIEDRRYERGETREARESDVAHLVPHVLEPIEAKAEPAPKNKAEPAAPANKAQTKAKAD